MADCNTCKDKNAKLTTEEQMRYAHDRENAFAERTVKRLWITIILLIALLVGSNALWIVYENNFEDVVVTQENADGYNNYIGENGDITN